jgi:hypothetical protein
LFQPSQTISSSRNKIREAGGKLPSNADCSLYCLMVVVLKHALGIETIPQSRLVFSL